MVGFKFKVELLDAANVISKQRFWISFTVAVIICVYYGRRKQGWPITSALPVTT